MRISEKVLAEINEKSFHISGMQTLVGLDGFVDKIVTPVDKRHGMGEQFDAVEQLLIWAQESPQQPEKVQT